MNKKVFMLILASIAGFVTGWILSEKYNNFSFWDFVEDTDDFVEDTCEEREK